MNDFLDAKMAAGVADRMKRFGVGAGVKRRRNQADYGVKGIFRLGDIVLALAGFQYRVDGDGALFRFYHFRHVGGEMAQEVRQRSGAELTTPDFRIFLTGGVAVAGFQDGEKIRMDVTRVAMVD